MNSNINNVNWDEITQNLDTKEFNKLLTDTINEQTDLFIPSKTITVRPK